jgi:glycosyltransferase involved in cell wall biosynthesis
LKITHYHRKSDIGAHSIEQLFSDLRSHLPDHIYVKTAESKYLSSGFFRRLYNIVQAHFHQSDINHVTGDVHFLTYLLKRNKTILTILDCVMMERLRGLMRYIFWVFWLWLPEKRCQVITVISEATRQQVINYTHCDPNKIRVIYCNVSDDFKPVLKTFDRNNLRILQVGTTPNKNIERVFDALTGIQCKLVIVGLLSDAHKAALASHRIDYENLENISREALIAQYVACDLLMFTSSYEGFGLPIVEANAVGRPVLTSNVWSMPEVAGNAACLVDPFNVTDIRAGVLRIVDDAVYRDQLVANGFENVKRFQLSNIAAQYATLYREVYEHSITLGRGR